MPVTVSAMVPVAERPSESATVNGRLFPPIAVDGLMTVANENSLSAAAGSPFDPSSTRIWLARPPIAERSATTPSPVLDGFEPGVTLTLNRIESPGAAEAGFAVPVPLGLSQGAAGDSEL